MEPEGGAHGIEDPERGPAPHRAQAEQLQLAALAPDAREERLHDVGRQLQGVLAEPGDLRAIEAALSVSRHVLCLLRPRLFHASFVVSRVIMICYIRHYVVTSEENLR